VAAVATAPIGASPVGEESPNYTGHGAG